MARQSRRAQRPPRVAHSPTTRSEPRKPYALKRRQSSAPLGQLAAHWASSMTMLVTNFKRKHVTSKIVCYKDRLRLL